MQLTPSLTEVDYQTKNKLLSVGSSLRQYGVTFTVAMRHHKFQPRLSHAPSTDFDAWRWAERLSIIGLFVLALGYASYAMQSVLVPVVLAWVIGTILRPLVRKAHATGVPHPLAVIGVTFTALGLTLAVFAILSTPLTYWIGRTQELGELIRGKLQLLNEPMRLFDELSKAFTQISGGTDHAAAAEQISAPGMITAILAAITPLLSEFVLGFFALVFFLFYDEEIKAGLSNLFTQAGARGKVRAILDDAEANTGTYFGTLAMVNVCLGVVATALAWAVGLPHPLLWGVLAGTLNFIPYLGPAIMVATLFVIGLMTFSTVGHALIAPLGYVAITTIEGQVITPTIVGHRLTLNPFLVFLSIAFWTWLWGAPGAFLAVPLLISSVVALRHLSENRVAETI